MEEAERKASLGIQGDQFAVENEVTLKRGESLYDSGEALVEHFLVSGKQHDLAPALQSNAPIAVEFDLEDPSLIRRQRRQRLALHRFNERNFAAPRLHGFICAAWESS